MMNEREVIERLVTIYKRKAAAGQDVAELLAWTQARLATVSLPNNAEQATSPIEETQRVVPISALGSGGVSILESELARLRTDLAAKDAALTQAQAATVAERYARERAEMALRAIGAHTTDKHVLALVQQGLGEET